MKNEGEFSFTRIYQSGVFPKIYLPLFVSRVAAAGFASPADDFFERSLDLNEYCVNDVPSVFITECGGDSMTGVGIYPGDLLVIDKSIVPENGMIVVAVVDYGNLVKRFYRDGEKIILYPENPNYQPIVIQEGQYFQIWGVVISVVRALYPNPNYNQRSRSFNAARRLRTNR